MKILLALTALMFVASCHAADSKVEARRGAAAWSAFECAVLASYTKNSEEQQRLFDFGLNEGRRFIAALQADQVRKEDIDSGVPMIVLMVSRGPSVDFMLGRLYQEAEESASKKVLEAVSGEFPPEDLRTVRAESLFRDKNCRLLGL